MSIQRDFLQFQIDQARGLEHDPADCFLCEVRLISAAVCQEIIDDEVDDEMMIHEYMIRKQERMAEACKRKKKKIAESN